MKALLALIALASCVAAVPTVYDDDSAKNADDKPKLLYILLDGFRFDYVDDIPKEKLPGFTELISNGVKAKWMNPLFPSLSYPSWTTLSTGLYAENHGIVGNYFYDAEDKDVFSLFDNNSTGKSKWWTAEPIWTTATKAGLRVALYLWARCDVPIDGVSPEYCERFQKITGPEIFHTNIKNALMKFDEGFDVVQVYTSHLDNIGHTIGPETRERRKATIEIDDTLVYLQEQLREREMEDKVNIVIVSDHGMYQTTPINVNRHEIDDFLPVDAEIESIADKGGYSSIMVALDSKQEVYDKLSTMPGVTVYKKEDIPDKYHIKSSKYIHDFILMAGMKTFMMQSRRPEALPVRDDEFVYKGAHGYDPEDSRMRAIFYAKGPAFKSNFTLEPINIVDVYQVLTKVLGIESRPNDGNWDNVEDAFAGARATGPVLPLMAGMALVAVFIAV